jgi:hypothetical protein
VGRVFTPCHDPSNTHQYDWGNGICRNIVTVRRSTDNREEITHLDASYDVGCL